MKSTINRIDTWYWNVIALACALIIFSCSPAIRLAKIEHKHPEAVYDFYKNKYPIKQSVKDSFIYIKGAVMYRDNYVNVNVDSLIKSMGLRKGSVSIPCPPCPYSVDTIKMYKETLQESTFKLSEVEYRLSKERTEAEKEKESFIKQHAKDEQQIYSEKKEKHFYQKILGGIISILIVYFSYKIYTKKIGII